jgi:hypothetical protein
MLYNLKNVYYDILTTIASKELYETEALKGSRQAVITNHNTFF